MEGTAITRPLWTVAVEQPRSHYECLLSVICNWFRFILPRTDGTPRAALWTDTWAGWWGLWQTRQGYISVWRWLICLLYKPLSTQRTWKRSPEWGTPNPQLPSGVGFCLSKYFLTVVPPFLFMPKYRHIILTAETGTPSSTKKRNPIATKF